MRNDEESVLLATALAMELSHGLTVDEIVELKNFLSQVLCSISSLLLQKSCKKE